MVDDETEAHRFLGTSSAPHWHPLGPLSLGGNMIPTEVNDFKNINAFRPSTRPRRESSRRDSSRRPSDSSSAATLNTNTDSPDWLGLG